MKFTIFIGGLTLKCLLTAKMAQFILPLWPKYWCPLTLWEEYIHLLVEEHFYHPRNKSKEGVEYLFSGSGDIYPDFIGKNQNQRIIADAKYKPIENIRGKDYLQLLAYMFRFDCKHGFYFYPEKEEYTVTDYYLNQGCHIENNVEPRSDVRVTKLGFRVPQAVNSYDEFSREIKETEDQFVKFIKQAMNDVPI